MSLKIFDTLGQCQQCHELFTVYLHQKPHRDSFRYQLEPSPYLSTQGDMVIHHHHECRGHIKLYGVVPQPTH